MLARITTRIIPGSLFVVILFGLYACKKKEAVEDGILSSQSTPKNERTSSDTTRNKITLGGVLSHRKIGNMEAEERETLRKKIAALSTQDLESLLDQLSEIRNSPENRNLFSLAIGEFAIRSPATVMNWFIPEKMAQGESGFGSVCVELARSRPDIIQNWLLDEMQRCEKGVQQECLSIAIGTWSKTDPESAFSFALSTSWKHSSINDLLNCFDFGAWDPQKSDQAITTTLKGRDLEVARYNIAMAVGEVDPDAGIMHAQKIPNSSERGQVIAAILSNLMDSDRKSAITKLQSLDSSDLQTTLQANAGTFLSITRKLAIENSDDLINLISTMIPTASNEAVFRDAIESISEKTPEKSLKLIESLPSGEMKTKLYGDHYHSIASSNPEKALELASNISDQKLKNIVYGKIGDVIGPKGWAKILTISNNLNQEEKTAFLCTAIPHIANENPQQTSNLITTGKIELPPEKKREIFSALGEKFSSSDSANSWLKSLPADYQPDAMRGIAKVMAQHDINGLATMLSTSRQDATWESGVRVLIDNIKSSDPEMARKWQDALQAAGYK